MDELRIYGRAPRPRRCFAPRSLLLALLPRISVPTAESSPIVLARGRARGQKKAGEEAERTRERERLA